MREVRDELPRIEEENRKKEMCKNSHNIEMQKEKNRQRLNTQRIMVKNLSEPKLKIKPVKSFYTDSVYGPASKTNKSHSKMHDIAITERDFDRLTVRPTFCAGKKWLYDLKKSRELLFPEGLKRGNYIGYDQG